MNSGHSDGSSIGVRGGTLSGPAGLAAALGPGALVVFLGFNAGAFYPGTTGLMAVLVLLALLGRVTLALAPAAGASRAGALVLAALALLAALSLLSSIWSGAPGRALADWDRVLLYAALFALGASVPYTRGRVRVALWSVGAGILVVVGTGVLSRVAPDVLHTRPDVVDERLSYPLSYWNGLGLLGCVGMLLALHATADPDEPRPVRVLAAAVLPLLALGVELTLSRGALAAGAVGLVVYVLVARPRGLVLGGLAAGVPAAVVAFAGSRADLLTSEASRTAAAAAQGHSLALVLVAATLGAALLRFSALAVEARFARADARWRVATRAFAALAAGLVLAGLVLGAPAAIGRQYHRFVDAAPVPDTSGAARFTQVGNNGRLAHWRVALDTWRDHPLLGTGAGTYENEWARRRDTDLTVVHAHSVELGMLSDLGLAGLGLLLVALVGLAVGVARRARGRDRAVQAALLAAFVAWALHSATDWTWELPGASAWVFGLGGLALARRRGAGTVLRPPGSTARVVAGVGLLVLALTPATMALSQGTLDEAVAALRARHCSTAIDRALASSSTLGARPEPYEVLGFCDVRIGRPQLGELMLRQAAKRDPGSWEYQYGLAIVRGAGGRDPRPALRRARELNPLSPLVREATAAFGRAKGPAGWRRAALRAKLP